MKKILLAIFLSGCIASTGFGQATAAPQTFDSSWKYGFGVDYANPVNTTTTARFTSGIGFTGKWEIPASNSLNVTITLVGEELDVASANQNFYGYNPSYIFYVPKVGLKYVDLKPFYIEGEVGYESCTSTDFDDGVALSIGIGGDFGALELGMRYESWGNNSEITQIAFHLGYRF